MSRNYHELIQAKWSEGKHVCVGLDYDEERVPKEFLEIPDLSIIAFNRCIIEATYTKVAAYKPNIAFYEAFGLNGLHALRETIDFIKARAPDVPVILDAKRADIGNTNRGYVKGAFDWLGADAITINPYFGEEAVLPFLEKTEKGIIILCRTSNPGAAEFQSRLMEVQHSEIDACNLGKHWIKFGSSGLPFPDRFFTPFYKLIAGKVAYKWNMNKNCSLVVGGTAPTELAEVRDIVGDEVPILIPGIGKQGGSIEKSVFAGKNSRKSGFLLNCSSEVCYAGKQNDSGPAACAKVEHIQAQIDLYLGK